MARERYLGSGHAAKNTLQSLQSEVRSKKPIGILYFRQVKVVPLHYVTQDSRPD